MEHGKIEGLADLYFDNNQVATVECDIYFAEPDDSQREYTGSIIVRTGGQDFETGDKIYLLVHQETKQELDIFFPEPHPVSVSNTFRIAVAPKGASK